MTGLARFQTLKQCPRELWLIYFLKFLESYAYFSMSLILTIYLSEFGFSDEEAGWAYGVFGTLTSAYGIVVGVLIDNLGVKASLVLGATLLTVGRTAVALTRSRLLLNIMLYTCLPLGSALGIPVMSTGIRRYTNASNRAFGFSLFYSVMNIAALLSGLLVDTLRRVIAADSEGASAVCLAATTAAANIGTTNGASSAAATATATTSNGILEGLGPYRIILLTGAGASALMIFVAACAIREVDVSESGETTRFTPRRASPWNIVKEIASESRFWRFILFVTILIGVKTVFRHLDATLPKYMIRSLGCDSSYGSVYAIDPVLVIFLVPLITAFTLEVSCFKQILVGSFITAGSVFIMVIASNYVAIIMFVVVLAFGEALWSPRLYEYSAIIAPMGREGTYMALASVPTFVAQIFTGGMSGWLLSLYCPCVKSTCEPCCTNVLPDGSEPCAGGRFMWLIIAVVTLSSPILLLLFSRVIQAATDAPVTTKTGDPSVEPGASGHPVEINMTTASGERPLHSTAITLKGDLDQKMAQPL
jgi:dipeptide/tripeptide permease